MVERYGVTIAAICCACLIYSGIYNLPQQSAFCSPLSLQQITEIEGIISSNPIKITSDNMYRVSISIQQVMGYVEKRRNHLQHTIATSKLSAYGQAQILLPAHIVEMHLPDGLYSQYNSGETGIEFFLIEKGTHIRSRVSIADSSVGYPLFYSDPDSFVVISYHSLIRNRCRFWLRQILAAWGDAGALVLALFSGATDTLDKKILAMFRCAGLAHILALSGMHLSLFAGMARTVTKRTGIFACTISAIAAATAFIWFAGNFPSLFRSFLCMLITTVCTALGRKPCLLNVLSAAFLAQTIIAPTNMKQLSCILSYVSLVGIIIIGVAARNLLLKLRLPYTAAEQLGSSIGAQIATTPITLIVFGTAAPIGIITSTIISPLISIFMIVSCLCIALAFFFPSFTFYSGIPVQYLYNIIYVITNYFAEFPLIILTA